jgi:pyruvate formate lyase activating enzyme
MIISGLIRGSLIDYPGVPSCVLFVPGCNYDCYYCHNRSILGDEYEVIDPELVQKFLEKRAGFLDGAVVTGGEPTLCSDLIPFIRMLKKLRYKVKLDTNGSRPEVIAGLLDEKLVDYYAVDYKAPASRYKEICGDGADAAAVLETIGLLKEKNARFEVRTTVVPELTEDDLLLMAQELPVLPKYSLNRYRLPEEFLPQDKQRVEKTPYTPDEIKAFAGKIKKFQPNVKA